MSTGSITRLQQLRQCPASLELAARGAHRVVPSYVSDGAYAHKAIEWMLLNAASGAYTLEALERILGEQFPRLDQMLLERLVALYTEIPLAEPGERVMVEETLRFVPSGGPCQDGEDAFWTMRPDYAIVGPKRLIVEDWKTGWGYGSDDELEQAQSYAGGILHHQDGYEPVEVVVRVRRPRRGKHQELRPSVNECRRVFQQALAEWARSQGVSEAKPGAHCSGCFVRLSCPAYRELATALEFGPPAAAWAQLKALDEQRSRLVAYLQASVETAGPVSIPGTGVLDLIYSESISLDPAKAWARLDALGKDPRLVLAAASLSRSALSRVLRKEPAVVEDLLETARKRISGRKKLGIVGAEEMESE